VLYLTGASNPPSRELAKRRTVGLMVQPGSGYFQQIPHYRCYAADNGCFNPDTYVGDNAWLDWVTHRLPRQNCLFVVVPDVARQPDGELGGDPAATWEKFRYYGPIVRAVGFNAALVAQDGMEDMGNVDTQLGCCDCLFIGGSDAWKESPAALDLAAKARQMGKWTHMGRVNSYRRYAVASSNLIDSCDGTYLAYGPDVNAARLERWLLRGAQLHLWPKAGEHV